MLVIRNMSGDSLRVEVRIGDSRNCELNHSAGIHVLPRGRVWGVNTEQIICWRSEVAPGRTATDVWKPWQQKKVPTGRVDPVSA